MSKYIEPNLTEKFLQAVQLHQKNELEKAKKIYIEILNKDPNFVSAHNNLGLIFKSIDKIKNAKICFEKTIKINPRFFMAYNNLGVLYKDLGEIEKAKHFYEKALEINPKFSDAYNNLGVVLTSLGKSQEAIDKYCTALKFNSRHRDAQLNIITDLTFFIPNKNKNNDNSIIIINEELRNINKNFIFEDLLKPNYLSNFFEKSNRAVNKIKNDINDLRFSETQTFRRNSSNLNCERHHDVFNKSSIIPKFCFSCFKIQIEPKNVFELLKLFFIFDGLKLHRNNWRKCTIELRKEIPGTYKGFIYCSSLKETNKILSDITPILKKFINYKVSIKRGCSEFYKPFPDFKQIDKKEPNYMEYNSMWNKIEENYNTKNSAVKKILKETISGLNISDFLTIKNWLSYAQIIEDLSYKEISPEVPNSKLILGLISNQLDFRKKQFLC